LQAFSAQGREPSLGPRGRQKRRSFEKGTDTAGSERGLLRKEKKRHFWLRGQRKKNLGLTKEGPPGLGGGRGELSPREGREAKKKPPTNIGWDKKRGTQRYLPRGWRGEEVKTLGGVKKKERKKV